MLVAQRFAELLRNDDRFELVNQAMGLVCFRVKVFILPILIFDRLIETVTVSLLHAIYIWRVMLLVLH